MRTCDYLGYRSFIKPTNHKCFIISGAASAATINKLAAETMKNDYLGIMVWYASVQNGLQYAESWDASMSQQSKDAYIAAGNRFRTGA